MKNATDSSKAQIVGIRMSPATIQILDKLVKECGYKSRSDCVKSLILERDAGVNAQTNSRDWLIKLIKEDVEIRDLIQSVAAVKINNITM